MGGREVGFDLDGLVQLLGGFIKFGTHVGFSFLADLFILGRQERAIGIGTEDIELADLVEECGVRRFALQGFLEILDSEFVRAAGERGDGLVDDRKI